MVSVKRCSLPSEYLQASKNLISFLPSDIFHVEYAFWNLRYGDDDHWTEGDWRLVIASDYYNNGSREAYSFIQNVLKYGFFTPIELSDIEITDVNLNIDVHGFDRVCVKEHSP